MADDKIALSIEIEADRAQMSLGELESGYKGLREQLEGTNRRTEEGRKEFKRLSTQMALASKEIKNMELGFEGLDREQIASELGSVSGAIGDVTASLILMGGESETLEQIGASIEKAMAISMGFKGAIEGLSSASKLYNNLVKQGKVAVIAKAVAEKAAAAGTWLMTAAQTAFNVVMSMNPIALVVIAITALVAGFILLGKNIKKVIDFALLPMTLTIELVKAALRSLGLMEESTAEQTKKAEEEKSQAAVESAEKRVKANEELIKSHKELTDKTVSFMDFEIRKRKAAGVNTIKWERVKLKTLIELAKKEAKLQEQRLIDLDNEFKARLRAGKVGPATAFKLLKAKTEASKAIIKANEEQLESEQDLEISTIESQKKIDDAAKKSSADRKAQREKDAEAARLKLIEDAKALAEFEEEQARIRIQLIQDEGERKRAEIEYNSQLELEALEKKGTLTFEAEMLIAQKKHQALAEITKAEEEKKEAVRLAQIELEKNLALKQLEAEKLLRDTKLQNDEAEEEIRRLAVEDEFQNKLATLEEQGLLTTELEIELTYAREQALFDIKEEFTEKERQSRLALNQERLESATQVIGAIGSLNSAALANDLKNAGDNEAVKERLRKASFEREKKLNIAMALINGAQAQMSILAQTPKADFGVATVIAMAAAAATTIGQIAAIKSTTYQGGGSTAPPPEAPVEPTGPDAGGGAQINAVTNTSTILGNQQVFVTETDITDTQNNVSVIEESATF
jgi:hypothetical protein